jgi:NADP-dependent 3-hydroxy acid dehydrogenase YdfG
MLLEGKVAVITGAATGIGRATATLFAGHGAAVVIADVNDDAGRATVGEIEGSRGKALFIRTDVTRLADLENLVRSADSAYGRLDIYFHNAGVAGPGLLESTTEEAYDLSMAVNLKAAFFGAKFAVPGLRRAGGGNILFTSSTSGVHPSPCGSPSYSVAKAGLVMLTRSLALQLAQDRIPDRSHPPSCGGTVCRGIPPWTPHSSPRPSWRRPCHCREPVHRRRWPPQPCSWSLRSQRTSRALPCQWTEAPLQCENNGGRCAERQEEGR